MNGALWASARDPGFHCAWQSEPLGTRLLGRAENSGALEPTNGDDTQRQRKPWSRVAQDRGQREEQKYLCRSQMSDGGAWHAS